MICKIYLKPRKGTEYPMIPITYQSMLNSYVHMSIGPNEYHDSFSNYAISNIQGTRRADKMYLKFVQQPYIQITSVDTQFINMIMRTFPVSKADFYGLVFDRFEVSDFDVWSEYDKVYTISPVIVYDENRMQITPQDEKFIERIKLNCQQKLHHIGIHDKTFNIELINPEQSRTKYIKVRDIWNKCSNCLFKISGQKRSRIALYNMGLGGSTGSGFGSVKLYTHE